MPHDHTVFAISQEQIIWFDAQLLAWFSQHGRHDLPWQQPDNPYAVWVSEIMLQQTQVKTVLHYYPRFMTRFPTVQDLATASWDEVAPYWAGLGYYARARNLHKAAKIVASSGFPKDLETWVALPGIGQSTAGALLSLGLNRFGVILDGNVKRVLARFFAIAGDLSKPKSLKPLWVLATQLTPVDAHRAYTQAIMDLGATICTPKKPLCLYCPLQQQCQAFAEQRVLDYPQKIIKKAVPIKHAHVLLIRHHQCMLWQKRPAQGIWGELYSLPILEQAEFEHLQQNAARHLSNDVAFSVTHHFTHFTWHLDCHILPVDAVELAQWAQHFAAEMIGDDEIATRGLPRAMQRILTELQQHSSTVS